MNHNPTDPTLQVLICTYGADGIRRVAKAKHPAVPGVEYLVSWQEPDGRTPLPPALGRRPDFKIVRSDTRGLSRNRNIALREATAPLCLISDDDVTYTPDELLTVIDSFTSHPEADIITFKYLSDDIHKLYPSLPFNLANPPKGYYISSIEIAFRREKVMESGVIFNENFGIGAEFIAGEENLFLHDLIRRGLKGIYLPFEIAYHPDSSTAERQWDNPDYIRTKGATFTHLHPRTWPLRMIAHALRHKKATKSLRDFGKCIKISSFEYLKLWLQGARRANKLRKS